MTVKQKNRGPAKRRHSSTVSLIVLIALKRVCARVRSKRPSLESAITVFSSAERISLAFRSPLCRQFRLVSREYPLVTPSTRCSIPDRTPYNDCRRENHLKNHEVLCQYSAPFLFQRELREGEHSRTEPQEKIMESMEQSTTNTGAVPSCITNA